MLKYLIKFVLDIMPSVVATIVGAYIVHHYVIPAATPKDPAAAAAAANPKPEPAKVEAAVPPPPEKASFTKGVAEKIAIEKTAEKASDKAADAPADSRKRHATTRAAKPLANVDQTASIPEPTPAEERRDANDLARAAIERLRTGETPRAVTAPAAMPAPAAMAALPPAVTLSTPSSEIFSAGTGAIVAPARPMLAPTPTRSADASRPLPPANIPVAPPLELHDDIVSTTTGRAATVAEDVVSAAKSVFHAVLPLK